MVSVNNNPHLHEDERHHFPLYYHDSQLNYYSSSFHDLSRGSQHTTLVSQDKLISVQCFNQPKIPVDSPSQGFPLDCPGLVALQPAPSVLQSLSSD
ncbi:hypothetical protein NQZ68_026552 [Dissostichus eleginoides]|nr:hypothetical protein NQZ68_026552 [Dissostichus eleginoides]